MRSYRQVLRGQRTLVKVKWVLWLKGAFKKSSSLAYANRSKGQGKGILYADEARTMVCRRQKDDAEAKIRCAQFDLEHAQKTARRDTNKKWKPVFQELRRKVREQNARLK